MTETQENFLAGTELFSVFSREELEEMAPYLKFEFRKYEKGEIIILEGEPAVKAAIAVSGEFKEFKMEMTAGERLVRLLHRGDTLGIPELLSSSPVWIHSLQCTEKGELVYFSIKHVMRLTDSLKNVELNLKFRNQVIKNISDNMIRLYHHLEVLSTNPLRSRILLVLRRMEKEQETKHVDLRMNRTQFAAYLAVDRSTLSRELRRMEKEGLILILGSAEYLLDPETDGRTEKG